MVSNLQSAAVFAQALALSGIADKAYARIEEPQTLLMQPLGVTALSTSSIRI